jgi:hypothetical protein
MYPTPCRTAAIDGLSILTARPGPKNAPAKIIVDSALARALYRGGAFVPYRTGNLHVVPVFGPAALAMLL